MNIKNLSLELHLIPYNQKGKIQVDFSDTLIKVEDYNADFSGSSDFSRVFNVILKNFKSFFKNEVANVLAMKISSTFEESFNSLLYQGPSILEVQDNGIFINYTLTSDPVFNKDYMTVPFDGSFLYKSDDVLQPGPEVLPIPSYYDQGKQL